MSRLVVEFVTVQMQDGLLQIKKKKLYESTIEDQKAETWNEKGSNAPPHRGLFVCPSRSVHLSPSTLSHFSHVSHSPLLYLGGLRLCREGPGEQ